MKRYEGILGLRGLGAAIIVAYHVYVLRGFLGMSSITDKTIGQGGTVVPLFFIISAFSCMCGYYNRFMEENSKVVLSSFYFGRIKRLIPTMYFALICHIIIEYIYNKFFNIHVVIGSASLLFGFMPQYRESFVNGAWALGIEMIFYFIFPAFLIFCSDKIKTWVTFSVVALLLSSYFKYYAIGVETTNNSEINIIRHLIFFVVGALIFHYSDDIERIKGKKRIVLYLVCLLILPISFHYYGRISTSVTILSTIIFFSIMIVNQIGFKDLIINNFIFKFLGKNSYQIYLFHMIIFKIFQYNGVFDNMSITNNGYINYFLQYISVLICTVILSVIFNFLVRK